MEADLQSKVYQDMGCHHSLDEQTNNVVFKNAKAQQMVADGAKTDIPIPATIFTKVFTGVTIVDDSNRFEFVRFDEEHEVKFFKGLKFIIDFDQYKEYSDEQLEEEVKRLNVSSF